MLTSAVTKKLDIPNEPGEWVTIRKLSHYQLSMAQRAKRDEALQLMKALEGVTLPASNTETSNGPEITYDRSAVLAFGVTEWSYPVNHLEGTADLDEETAVWLFVQIMEFSIRSAAEVKASADGSQPSTDQAEVVGQPS